MVSVGFGFMDTKKKVTVESVKENATTQKTGHPIMANPSSAEPVVVPSAPLRTVSKMLIFYSDGTFEER